MAQYAGTRITGRAFSGKARIINPTTAKEREEQIDAIQQGDIIITPNLDPDYVYAFKKANGIIAERGGRLSHTAVIANERGFPIMVLDCARDLIKSGVNVSVVERAIYVGEVTDA